MEHTRGWFRALFGRKLEGRVMPSQDGRKRDGKTLRSSRLNRGDFGELINLLVQARKRFEDICIEENPETRRWRE